MQQDAQITYWIPYPSPRSFFILCCLGRKKMLGSEDSGKNFLQKLQ
jgi:hypothetical protein